MWVSAYNNACLKYHAYPAHELSSLQVATTIDLTGNCAGRFLSRLGENEVKALAEAIIEINTTIELFLDYNLIGDEGAIALAEMLRQNSSIQVLSLGYNRIGPKGAKALADSMMGNSTVISFNVCGNPIGDDGGVSLAEMMRYNTNIACCNISNCDLGMNSLHYSVQALYEHPSISSLKMDRPLLKGPSDVQYILQHLANSLKHNNVIEELSIAYWGITDSDLESLLPDLVNNNSLRVLNLKGNRLSMDGGALAATLLKRRQDLIELDLSSNRVENEGAEVLSEVIASHPHLRQLDLRSNNIGDKGLCALAEAVMESHSLRTVYLWGNRFGKEASRLYNEGKEIWEGVVQLDFGTYVVDERAIVSRA